MDSHANFRPRLTRKHRPHRLTSGFDLILCNYVARDHDGQISQSPQLGLVYIATVAKEAGFRVTILAGDAIAQPLAEAVRESNSPLVGFYTNSDSYGFVLRLALLAKGENPACKVILGGPLATSLDQEIIANDQVDFVARGDGEYLTLELLSMLRQGSNAYEQIEGLTYKAADEHATVTSCAQLLNGGEVATAPRVARNPPRARGRQLDDLPIPDRSLYPTQHRALVSYIVSSRGCGYKCTFCFESTNRKLRSHSPDRVIEEIRQLRSDYGTRYVCFVDDVFTSDHKRVRAICERMEQEFEPGRDLFWYCEGRVDNLARQPDLLPKMKAAGLTRIQIGTESGSQAVIDAYRKHITIQQIREAVANCRKHEILSIYTNFILGGALETRETFEETKTLALDLMHIAPGRMEISCNFLSPYPGTDIYNRPDHYNVRILDPAGQPNLVNQFQTGLSDNYVFAETTSLSKEDLLSLSREFKAEIRSAMTVMTPSLPTELVAQHLMMRAHGLNTFWSDHLLSDPILRSWCRFLEQPDYSQQPAGSMNQVFPTRTIDLKSLASRRLTWMFRRVVVDFSPFEVLLLELASGKNSLSEILELAYDFHDGRVCRELLKQDISGYYSSLAEQFLVVYKQFGPREPTQSNDLRNPEVEARRV